MRECEGMCGQGEDEWVGDRDDGEVCKIGSGRMRVWMT